MKRDGFKRLPNCLRKFRKARGLSQIQVARLLDLKNTTNISKWENGLDIPNTLYLVRMAVIYRTMVDALIPDLIHLLKGEIAKKESKFLETENQKR